jgi:Uma2 family endonuclease
MAATAEKLTIADFERQYGDAKPYHEYWFGEAIPKAMPTWPHGLLQKIVMVALDQAGYKSASEVKLKISSDFEPVPDVIATAGRVERPYPTKPMEVVVEILSPEDSFQRVLRKCKLYSAWGIPLVVVLDPEGREGWTWERQSESLKPTTVIALENGQSISLDRIFRELDEELQ